MSETAAAILETTGHRLALFVDFDGTLVDLAQTPDAITVPEGLASQLAQVSEALGGAFALVSGRPVADLERYLGHPIIAMAGSHGAELRFADRRQLEIEPEIAAETKTIADGLQHLTGLDELILVEPKTGAVAVHFRRAPERAEACHSAVAKLVETQPDWSISTGKAIVEARRKDMDKGAAVRRFMGTEPFAGRVPVFIGDDATDEDGMKAATQLGGFGVKVGDGDSVARFRIADVPTARAVLIELATTGVSRRSGPESAAGQSDLQIP